MYCKNCGILNDEDAEFCKKCGFNLTEENVNVKEEENSSTKEKKQKPKKVKNKTKTKIKKIKEKPKKQEKQKKEKKNKNNIIIKKEMSFAQSLLMLFLFLLVIVLLGVVGFGAYYIWNNQSVEVPSVVNLSYEKAELTLAKSNLGINKVEKIVEDKTLDGIVISQNKNVNKKVLKNTIIKVAVGVYQKKYTVQNFIGMELDTVTKILDINNVTYKINYEETDKYDSNIILSQTPKRGTKLEDNEIVTLSVSKKISSTKNNETTSESTNDTSSDNSTADTNKVEDNSDETSTDDIQ